MSYSLLLIEEKQPNNHSLLPALNRNSFQIITISSLPELAGQLNAVLPDAIVINETRKMIDLAAVRTTIDDTKINIPCVSVTDSARQPIDGEVGITKCSRRNVAKTVAGVLKDSPLVRVGNIALDSGSNTLWMNGICTHLTPKMAGLMRVLLQNEGKIVYRETIMREIWQTDYMGDTRTLDVHVRWLREKLEANPSRPRILLTVRGAGYRLIAPKR